MRDRQPFGCQILLLEAQTTSITVKIGCPLLPSRPPVGRGTVIYVAPMQLQSARRLIDMCRQKWQQSRCLGQGAAEREGNPDQRMPSTTLRDWDVLKKAQGQDGIQESCISLITRARPPARFLNCGNELRQGHPSRLPPADVGAFELTSLSATHQLAGLELASPGRAR
mmetsp:Transcript_61960/g.128575  ORF Transcript_61960/g.128575 Transcript_61960/m.128575 type:complete len:168 (-) Transcript_61960:225-728(-)